MLRRPLEPAHDPTVPVANLDPAEARGQHQRSGLVGLGLGHRPPAGREPQPPQVLVAPPQPVVATPDRSLLKGEHLTLPEGAFHRLVHRILLGA